MNNEKKKFNPLKSITFCLCSLMFVASFALIAVSLALSLVDITAGGHISFTASGVYAKVTGALTGTKTTNNLDTLNFDATTESFTTPDSWKNMILDFTNDNLITLTVNFQNLSEEISLYVVFTDGFTVTNVTTTRMLDGSSTSLFQVLEVPASTTKTAIITLKVDNLNKSVSSDFTLNMKLSGEGALDASTYTTLSFTYDNSDLTASVESKKSTNEDGETYGLTSGNFVIPSKIKYNGKIYTVTKILKSGFEYCFDLNSIRIPWSITRIGSRGLNVSGLDVYLDITEGWKAGNVVFDETISSQLKDPTYAGNLFSGSYGDCVWVRS